MTDKKKRVGILISGRGSNMMSLIAAARAADYPAEIACVLSNRPEAEGLFKAAGAGLQTRVVDHKHLQEREAFEAELDGLAAHGSGQMPRIPLSPPVTLTH